LYLNLSSYRSNEGEGCLPDEEAGEADKEAGEGGQQSAVDVNRIE
jgi:hypothetical protein